MKKIIALALVLCMAMSFMVVGASAADETYTKIEKIADLTPGTYYMAAYCESYNSNGTVYHDYYWHFFTGAVSSGDLATEYYTFENGKMTDAEPSDTETAVAVELIAVDGKANTYYIYVDGKGYVSCTDAANNRKLAFSNTPMEWVASNNSKGGINMSTTISGKTCSFGSAKAKSAVIRSYKSSSAGSSLGYGVYFFKQDGATSTECAHTNLTATGAEPATCAKAGNKAYWTCNECNQRFLDAAATQKATAADIDVPATGEHNYGTDNKCTVCKIYKPDSTLTVKDAYAYGKTFEKNTYTTGKYYVEGKIKSIANTTYGNLTIEDAEGNTLYIYGLYSADGSTRFDKMTTKPAVGDTIKVYGILGAYDDAQMKNGWMVAHTPAGSQGGNEGGNEGGSTTPVAPTDPKEIVDALYQLAAGEKLPYKATLTGKITSIDDPYSEQYKNITVTIVVEGREEKPIIVFRVKGTGAETLAVGDVITVTGELMNYSGKFEFNSGCTLDAVIPGTNAPTGNNTLLAAIAVMVLAATGTALIAKKREF